MTLRGKITLLFSLVTATIILLFSSLVYFFANQNAFADFFKRLELRAILAAKVSLEANEENSAVYSDLRKQYLEKLPAEQQYVVKLGSNLTVTDPSALPQVPTTFLEEAKTQQSAFHRNGNLFYAGLIYPDDTGNYLVIVSARNEYGLQFLNNLRWLLIVSFVIKALIVVFIAVVFSRQILKPVHDITERVKKISAQSLHVRLQTGDGKDEMSELAHTFNHMLDRLETSFESQNNFVSNASHELSTPLTSIIGEAEWALIRERTPQEYQLALQTIQKQAERLDKITKSLLSLAQTGFDGSRQSTEQLRIDELLWTAKQHADDIYPNTSIQFDYSLMPESDDKLVLFGNAPLLQMAFTNLLMNACKYSKGNPVAVSIAASLDKVVVVIKDGGIGIPQKDLPYIFDPFFRASNTIDYKGYGIGLPLTRNIIRMHDGEIKVESEEGRGTTIVVKLPVR